MDHVQLGIKKRFCSFSSAARLRLFGESLIELSSFFWKVINDVRALLEELVGALNGGEYMLRPKWCLTFVDKECGVDVERFLVWVR